MERSRTENTGARPLVRKTAGLLCSLFLGFWGVAVAQPSQTAVAVPSAALAQLGNPSAPNVVARLVSEVIAVEPGKPFWVALRLEHAPTWHTYWSFPGDAGLATEIAWDLPPGFSAGPIQWPVPKVYLQEDIVNYVYEGTTLLLVEITPPAVLPGASVVLRGEASWLECDPSQCVPGGASVSLNLPVAPAGASSSVDSARAAEFGAARAAWPVALAGLAPGDAAPPWGAEVTREGDHFRVVLTPTVSVGGLSAGGYLFPLDGQTATTVPPGATISAETRDRVAVDGRFLEVAVSGMGQVSYRLPVSPYLEAGLERFRVVATLPGGWPGVARHGMTAEPGAEPRWAAGLLIDVPMPPAGASSGAATREGGRVVTSTTRSDGGTLTNGAAEIGEIGSVAGATLPLGLLLLAGFVGGFILNVMPCVFPVIGLKIMGFVQQAGEDRREVVRHGVAFSVGVLVCFWLLATVLILVQGSWGFQMQSPSFVWVLAVFFLLFGLNLSGVFEVGTSATGVGQDLMRKKGLTGSFFTGALAVVVATPCSAPILATALGATATLPPWAVMLIFTAIGLGLALPYLLLSIFPGAVNKLPRPGPWMETLKQGLAFPLYAFTGYLIFVLAGLVGEEVLRNLVIALALVGLAGWVFGRYGHGGQPIRARRMGQAIAATVLFGVTVGLLWQIAEEGRRARLTVAIASGEVAPTEANFLTFEPWSEAAVAAGLAEGRAVYIDFTARWCATCQTNKYVYAVPEVIAAYRENNVVMLRADFTRRDAATAAAIRSYGANAIPLNVLHRPDSSQPNIFSAALTPGELIRALD